MVRLRSHGANSDCCKSSEGFATLAALGRFVQFGELKNGNSHVQARNFSVTMAGNRASRLKRLMVGSEAFAHHARSADLVHIARA